MHEAHNVDMMLHVTSRPIIEDSDNIQVCEWNINVRMHSLFSKIQVIDFYFYCMQPASTNYFDQIEDFNWLKKQASPNWNIIDQEKKHLLQDSIKTFQENNEKNVILFNGMKLLPV
jgi:hypothetical protein